MTIHCSQDRYLGDPGEGESCTSKCKQAGRAGVSRQAGASTQGGRAVEKGWWVRQGGACTERCVKHLKQFRQLTSKPLTKQTNRLPQRQ